MNRNKNRNDPRYAWPLPPEDDERPPWRRPEYVLDRLVHHNSSELRFTSDLMRCVEGADVGYVLKHLPADMFDEFKEMLTILDKEDEETFVILGSVPAGWDQGDVRAVLRYLEAHPNPELAPPLAVLKAASASASAPAAPNHASASAPPATVPAPGAP